MAIGNLVAAAFLVLATSQAQADAGGTRTYRVTIQNLTPARGGGASQVLSPALVLAHAPGFHLFRVGQPANQAVIDVAEDAITATGLATYSGNPEVANVAALGSPLPPGQTESFEFTIRGDADRPGEEAHRARAKASERGAEDRSEGFDAERGEFSGNGVQLSLVTMLVSTNDGFTGLDAVQLPGKKAEYLTMGYDAGSEVNDQLKASIPGPCCGDTGRHGVHEFGVITHHQGILPGVGDLDPAIWGWPTQSPVARIIVERVR